MIGVIQEQHPDRCRLFAQWQEFDWPILHDPVNKLRARAVPYFIAIDEAGLVVDANLRTDALRAFLDRPAPETATNPSKPSKPELAPLIANAEQTPTAGAWTLVGDHRILWGGPENLDDAIQAYREAIDLDPDSAASHFGLGVAYRMRFDSENRKPDDFQNAIDSWGRALALDPNQYIYRRRIQQYGPRLSKPYPFYDWVTRAQSEIRQRGETPLQLSVLPSGAEIAHPEKEFAAQQATDAEPDPRGRIQRDTQNFIGSNVVVVPSQISAGESLRVHVEFDPALSAHWNNEAEPLLLWIETPNGWSADQQLLQSELPATPESTETRNLEFELQSSADNPQKSLRAYALYYVCEEQGGKCLFLRQDIEIPIRYKP